MMILSLESYSAVIIRLDLSRDCPPYDPVTPLKALGLSWASVLPLCRLIGPQLIYLLLLLWLLLWLYYVWSAAYAPMPRPHPSSGSGQCHLWPCEKFHFRSSVQSFEYSTKFSIVVASICHCAGQQIPPNLWSQCSFFATGEGLPQCPKELKTLKW